MGRQTTLFGVPHKAFRRPVLCAFLCLVAAHPTPVVRAQTIVLRDGTSVPVNKLRREGQTLMNAVSAGEVGYPVANIARIEFPEPPLLESAADNIAQGKLDAAIRDLGVVTSTFAPLKDIPGNWWTPAALMKTSVLLSLNRLPEAKTLLTQIAESPLDKPAAELAKLRLVAAFPVPAGGEDRALQACDAVLRATDTPRELDAEAWLLKGRLLLGRKEFEPALLAYLHLPALYYEQKRLQPAALLGSGRAYVGMKDEDRARRTFQELIAAHPAAPEAASAKTEIQTLDNAKAKKKPGPKAQG